MKSNICIFYSFFLFVISSIIVPSKGIAQLDSNKIKYLEMSLEEILNLEVTTVLKTSGKYSEVPATIHLITHEQILTRGYTCLEEVLEDIPEIEIQKKASAEYVNSFTLRGVHGTEKFIIMMDGMRINSPTGTPLSIVNNYPVLNAKQIEVILGPASALYGVDAFTGIINIITFTGLEVKGINVNASYGMYNTSDNSFIAGANYSDVSFSLTGKYYMSDEPNFPDIYPEEFAWYNNQYSQNGEVLLPDNTPVNAPIYDYKTPTNSYAFHAKLNIKEFEAGYFRNYESHSSSFSVKPEYTIYAGDAIFGEWVESMYVSHNHELENKKWKFYTTLSHSKDEVDPKSHFINSFTSYNKGYKYAYNKALKFEEQVSYIIRENTSLIAGFSFQDITALPKSGDLPFAFDRSIPPNLQNMYYLGTNVTDSAGNDLSIMQDFYFLQYQNYGFYLQSHINIKEKLSITLGGRFDYNTRYEYSINPRAGIVYSPMDKLKVKLLYGKAFFAPSPYSAYQHYGSFVPVTDSITGEITGLSASFWRLPSKELKSQEVSTYEASFSYFINKDIFVSANGFYNDLENLLTSEGNFGEEFHGIPVSYIQRPLNKGSSNSFGATVKLNVKTDFNTLKLNSYLAYSYIDGKIEDKGLAFTAKNTVKGGIDINIKHFSMSMRFLYRSKSYHRSVTDSNGNIVFSEPYTIFNLAARYVFVKSERFEFTTFLKVKNLLDTKYYNIAIGGSESFSNIPQDPIRINIGLSFFLK